MRIVIGTDSSPDAEAAVEAVAARSWPAGSEVRVVSVLDTMMSVTPDASQPSVVRWVEVGNEEEWGWVRQVFEPSADIPVLPLDREAVAAAVGKEVVMMGYPSGPNRLLALLPEAEAFGLQNKYGASLVTLLDQLQKRKLIKPLTTQGHITDLYQNRIVFDAATSEGASGTPMFGQSGRVIGVTFAVFIENSASNFAVPMSSGIALLESAGWRQKMVG